MLTLPPGLRIYLATARVDGRKGIDGLANLVRAHFGRDPLQGDLFAFFSRRADRVRVLYWDRDGYVLTTKRLEQGTSRVPANGALIRTGALWSLAGDHRYALFFAAPTGHADPLKQRLKGYRLALAMCDGLATNNVIEAEDGCGAVRGGCWAHARRKLVVALRGGDERATEALEITGANFHVDAESSRAGESTEQRLARRRRDSAPLMERLLAWCNARHADVEPKCSLGTAIKYLRNQWVRLSRFLEYAAMELTNNETERDLRRHVPNRKTWFFVGHDENARRNADALTVLTTCHKMGIDPRAYLRDTLRRMLAGEKDLTVMLPESYAARVAAASAATTDPRIASAA